MTTVPRGEGWTQRKTRSIKQALSLIRVALRWRLSGSNLPMPAQLKQEVVKSFARRFGISVLVETGTYSGQMIAAALESFDLLYSIELDHKLHEAARARFSAVDRVHLLEGDSGVKLEEVLKELDRPAVFWLDAHYSEGVTAKGSLDTPIMTEVRLILEHHVRDHVVLIDDARLFVGANDYPSIEEVQRVIIDARPDWQFVVKGDIIRAHRELQS